MRSDDELLSHIRQQAGGRRQRRQRAIAGAAAAAVVLLLGVGALAANGGDGSESVKAEDGGAPTTDATTTTTEAPSTTEEATTTSTTSTTTTTAPPGTEPTPTTTEAPPTTTEAPPSLPSEVAVGDGITVEATVTAVDGGRVTLSIRIRADHGSHPGGLVWGETVGETAYGFFAEYGPTSCDALIDDDPATTPGDDPAAGPVDETFTVVVEDAEPAAEATIRIRGNTSWCTSDESDAVVTLVVPLGG